MYWCSMQQVSYQIVPISHSVLNAFFFFFVRSGNIHIDYKPENFLKILLQIQRLNKFPSKNIHMGLHV